MISMLNFKCKFKDRPKMNVDNYANKHSALHHCESILDNEMLIVVFHISNVVHN